MRVEVGCKTDISGMKVTVYPPGYVIGYPSIWRHSTHRSLPGRKLYYWFKNTVTGEILHFEDGRIALGDYYEIVHVQPENQ